MTRFVYSKKENDKMNQITNLMTIFEKRKKKKLFSQMTLIHLESSLTKISHV